MRILYILLYFFAGINILSAQFREVPLRSNPVVKKAYNKRLLKDARQIQDATGVNPLVQVLSRQNCPEEEVGVFYVFTGNSINITVDTIDLNSQGGPIRFLTDIPLDFGTATFDTLTLTYKADLGIAAGRDTLRVELCRPNGACDVLTYQVVAKRPNETHIIEPPVWQAQQSDVFCVDLDPLPGELVCNQIVDCPGFYEGDGQQQFYFTRYDQPDSCLFYRASRFAGTDTVCLVFCDEFTVCDTFKVLFRIDNDTLQLPFFDDFAYAGPYPSAKYWLDEHTYINSTSAVSPPSIGFATFDGLKSNGQPHTGGYGVADYLTSKPIDLSNFSAANNIILSFYLAPKGLSYQPFPQDSFVLEFRNDLGEWEQITAIPGPGFLPINEDSAFVFNAFGVNEPQYFHDAFQFRFKNYNPRTGAYSTWHLDYVYMDINRAPIPIFEDVAWVKPPDPILKRYFNMPARQLLVDPEKELIENIDGTIFNSTVEAIITVDNRIAFRELTSGNSYQNFPLFNATNIPSLEEITVNTMLNPNTRSALIEDMTHGNLSQKEVLVFEIEYALNRSGLSPLAFENDTISRQIEMADYFAYDDGTAERALESNSNGSQIAIEFEANTDDVMRGVMLHFPHVNGDVQSQLFNLRIWQDSLNSTPIYQRNFIRPFYADNLYDTLSGYTTYVLTDTLGTDTPQPVPIKAGKFFVGWQQASTSSSPIPVGFDKNSPEASQYIWYNTGSGWRKYDDLVDFKGAVMLRPVFSNEAPFPTPVEEHITTTTHNLMIVPNPASQRVRFDIGKAYCEDCSVQIINRLGQILLVSTLDAELDVSELPSGLYFVRITDYAAPADSWQGKMIISR